MQSWSGTSLFHLSPSSSGPASSMDWQQQISQSHKYGWSEHSIDVIHYKNANLILGTLLSFLTLTIGIYVSFATSMLVNTSQMSVYILNQTVAKIENLDTFSTYCLGWHINLLHSVQVYNITSFDERNFWLLLISSMVNAHSLNEGCHFGWI